MGLAALVVTTLVVATLCVCPTSGGSSAVSSGDKRVQTSTSLFDRIARKQGSGRSRFGEDDSQAATADGREKPIVSSERRAGTSTGRTQPVSASRSGDAVRSNSRSKNVSPLEVTTKTDAEPDVATPQRSAQSGSGTSSRSRVRPSDAASHTESETNDDESRTCEIREQPHTIVDVQQSFKKGAEGILKTNTTYDDCITQCCANKQCNTAVFESGSSHSGTSSRRTRTSTCYLFNCDNLHANRCVLSAHPQYTTIQMAAAFRALGERCDERATDYCRDMQAVCTNSVCECAQGYVKQYGRCVPLRCGPDEFQCWSLPNATESQAPVCIASYNRCDSRHIPQCPDGSDEFDCAEGTVDSAARGDPNPNPNPNRHSSNGATNSRKTTARAGLPISTPKAAARIDDAPQPFDSVFGANITQMWNVHAILNGLFEHRGAQLEDSSVSEQNALIVAIVLLVGGLVMTTVLITLVGCNLRRLLGLSKRRYPRRSANGDAERLVNGLNL